MFFEKVACTLARAPQADFFLVHRSVFRASFFVSHSLALSAVAAWWQGPPEALTRQSHLIAALEAFYGRKKQHCNAGSSFPSCSSSLTRGLLPTDST